MKLDQRTRSRVYRMGKTVRLLGVLAVGGLVACSGDSAPEDTAIGRAVEANGIGVDVSMKRIDPGLLASLRDRSQLAYHDTWRKLWEDHITWTRMVIVGVLDCLDGTDVYTARLLQNRVDMEATLLLHYNAEDVAAFGKLMEGHLVIAAGILEAARVGDTEEMNTLVADWRENGHELATQMNKMNPEFWEHHSLDMMWQAHLDITLAEATAHLTGDFAGEVAIWEKVHEGGLMMADLFSVGTMRANPGSFQGCIVP